MSRRIPSISVYFVRAVLHNAVAKGVDPVALLRQNRISPRLLGEPDARVSIERFADLQVTTMLAMQDEMLGYGERRMPIGSWAMMCYAVMGSETLGQALSRYCRFFRLFEFGLWSHLEEGEEVYLEIRNANPDYDAPAYLYELGLFNAHRFASWLIAEHLPLTRVELSVGGGADLEDYQRMFLGNPILPNQATTRLVFAPAQLDKRVVQNEQSLRRFLRHPVLAMMTQRFNQDSWTAQVRQQLSRMLMETPELNDIAAELALHPQTLRRRLAAEGTSFKELKNQVRRDTALHYLGRRGLSIEDIAHRSGFSESSAFIRAFKGWTGVTPYTYRKGL